MDDFDIRQFHQHLDRHERLERWLCFAATAAAIGLTLGAFALYGFFAGITAGVCFILGVVAQRA